MLTADEIIDRLGGTTAVAEALELSPTTVSSWRPVNFIPRWRKNDLLRLAATLNVALSTADFPTACKRKPRAKKAA